MPSSKKTRLVDNTSSTPPEDSESGSLSAKGASITTVDTDPFPSLPSTVPPRAGQSENGWNPTTDLPNYKMFPEPTSTELSTAPSISISSPDGEANLMSDPHVEALDLADPFRPFDRLPAGIVSKILAYVFADNGLSTDRIWPFYRQGMLAGYIRTGAGNEVIQENIDLHAMQVNKQFRDAGSRAFYADHEFIFTSAALCKWWFKHIGAQNVSNVRTLSVEVRSGYEIEARERSSLDSTCEEQWYQFFCWLRNRHNLKNIRIDLVDWYRGNGGDAGENEEMHRWRVELLAKVSTMRGLSHVQIKDYAGIWVRGRDSQEMGLMMCQKETLQPPRKDRRDTPLSEVLRQLKFNARAKAKVEEEERRRRQDRMNAQRISEEYIRRNHRYNFSVTGDASGNVGNSMSPFQFYAGDGAVMKKQLTYSKKDRARFSSSQTSPK